MRERVVTIPVSYLDKTIFIGNAQEQAKTLAGVSTPPLWLSTQFENSTKR
jgi:hypothetical protein